jgi:hypothetical protein
VKNKVEQIMKNVNSIKIAHDEADIFKNNSIEFVNTQLQKYEFILTNRFDIDYFVLFNCLFNFAVKNFLISTQDKERYQKLIIKGKCEIYERSVEDANNN